MNDTPKPSNRLLGMDVARAIAIGGMALVHFAMGLSSHMMDGSTWEWFFNRLAGRPATVFMVLSGIGISLRFVNKTDVRERSLIRKGLVRRGCFFLVAGFLNLVLWPGDILRVYGIAYLFAAIFAFTDSKRLLAYSVAVVAFFTSLFFFVDFATNWDFETLEYANLWTFQGGMMNLIYNGFRAVLPWIGIMFFGMWIGRFDLRSSKVRRALMACGLIAWVSAETLSFLVVKAALPFVSLDDAEAIVAIFGTESLPPMPLFLASSTGLAIFVITGCIHLCESWRSEWWMPLANSGQLAFTWYIAHIFLVIAAVVAIDMQGNVSLPAAYLVSGGFFVVMCLVSYFYRKRYRHGPLEWALRRVAG